MTLYFYMRENCPLCDEAEQLLEVLQLDYHFTIEKRNIEEDDQWLSQYQMEIPVVEIGEDILYGKDLNLHQLEKRIKSLR